MKKKKVLAYKCLPTKYPTVITAVVYLYLREFHAADWLKGVIWTVLAIAWIVTVWSSLHEEEVVIKQLDDNIKGEQ